MSDEPVRLSASAEALLGATSFPERDDWEAMAVLIDERVRETEAKSTAPLWLMAPLPDEAHEPGALAAAAEATAGSADASGAAAPIVAAEAPATVTPMPSPVGTPSLAALARSVAQKAARPETARIAKESLSVVAAARAPSEALAERVRNARPAPPSQRGDVRAPLPAPTAAEAHPAHLASRRSDLGPWIAIGGLGFALAAALLVIARGREPAQLVVAQPAPLPATASAAPHAAEHTGSVTPGRDSDSVALTHPPLPASALPLLPKPTVSAQPRPSEQLAMASRSTSAGDAHAGARPAPEAIQLEEAPAKAAPVAEAAAPTPSGMRPAAGSASGGLPSRPSTGAVQAAVGSVMGSARACVAGGAASQAQITFGPDGAVSSVSVSGPAAGTAAASCIEAALRRARVAPFTNPTFSLSVWVRP